jgi:hypothetical protein
MLPAVFRIVPHPSYVDPMFCTPLSPAMRTLLDTLRSWPDVDVDPLRQTPEWEQARAWGWVMESGELTGSGLAHVGGLPGGLVKD